MATRVARANMALGSFPTPLPFLLLLSLILSSFIAFASADATSNAIADAASTGCYWLPSSYGECDVSCGTGVQTRSVSCYCGDDIADEASCASLAQPDTVTSCTLACVTFEWATTEWSGCDDVECGLAYSSRSVSCLGSNGMTIEPTYCDGEQPSENLLCHPTADCSTMTNATWNWGEWTSCSASCGTGHETRDRWCIGANNVGVVDDTNCDFDGLPTYRECNLGACEVFEWSTDSYSECSVSCGTGYESRSVTCVSSSRGVVASVECEAALGTSRPESVIRCYAEECDTYVWAELGFGDCSATCGVGEQIQQIECVSALTGLPVDSNLCVDSAVPPTLKTCEVVCATCEWSVTASSGCSASCGLGEEVREVTCQCSDGTVDTTLTMCSEVMPDTVEICSLATCPVCEFVPGAYGECSATCGYDGVKTREATCFCDGAVADASSCSWTDVTFFTSESCNQRDCPTYEWVASGFGNCSVTCGDGFKYQTVKCMSSEGEWVEASFCSESDRPALEEACDTGVVCEGPEPSVTGWSTCSSSCGAGTQTREVTCMLAGVQVADSECDLSSYDTTVDCNDGPCETLSWFEGEWSECTSTCTGGVKTRDVTCVSNERGVVEDFNCDADTKPISIENCNEDVVCPVYLPFGAWSTCSTTCGAGVSSLSLWCMDVTSNTTVDIAYCNTTSVTTSAQLCSLEACEVFTWVVGNWTTCSSSCGAGSATREVTCVGSYGTVDAAALHCNSTRPDELADCEAGACPTYSWQVGQYGDCSATCDAGVETRLVWCESSLGETVDSSFCVAADEPSPYKDCDWTECESETYTTTYSWATGDYSVCDVACGTGYKTRSITCTRTVTVTDISSGNVTSVTVTAVEPSNCASLEPPATSSLCDTDTLCISLYWIVGEPGECSASCGSGFQERTVVCYDPNTKTIVDDSECTDVKPDVTLTCSLGPCETWTWEVSSWSNCSASCGYGLKNREVTCVSSQNGVVSSSHCVSLGDAPTDHATCDTEVACVTCEWVRSDWSSCSATCGLGERTRTVTCNCTDGTTEDSSCADQGSYQTFDTCFESSACETYDWVNGTWSECSVTCGNGTITRTVECVGTSGTIDSTGLQCAYEGSMVSSMECSEDACEVFEWVYSVWGTCSASCGFGTQVRTATCTGSYGTIDESGDQCGDDSEPTSRDCFPKTCEICSWQVGTLSDCDVSCGDGVQTREVACVGNRGSVCDVSECAETAPDATIVCELAQCTAYSWYVGAYGSCSVTCGSGTKSRDVYCHDTEGLVVDASYCSGDHPGYDAVCETGVTCTNSSWTNGEWTDCSASCGAGTKSRTVTCVAVDGTVLDDSYCEGDAPAATAECNLCGCETTAWEISSWADCSVTCGTGYQTRETDCRSTLRGYVSATECSEDAPVDHQICVSVCHDWVAGAWGACVDGVYTRNVYCVGSDGSIDATGALCTGEQLADTGVCA